MSAQAQACQVVFDKLSLIHSLQAQQGREGSCQSTLVAVVALQAYIQAAASREAKEISGPPSRPPELPARSGAAAPETWIHGVSGPAVGLGWRFRPQGPQG